MQLTLAAPAKVNLHLKVLGRRADGYHELLTLMQPLDLADEVTVRLGGRGLVLQCDRPELDGPDNLAWRAAAAWYAAAGREPSARIGLAKRVPLAAGLGGGSSDAAAVLLALNALHNGLLPPERLAALAAGLGADVAFFLAGETALCAGVGERVRPWPDFPLLDYVLVNPGFAVSTAWVYAQLDLAWTKNGGRTRMGCSSGSSLTLAEILVNDLELATLAAHPELSGIKQRLMDLGARGALMSGSGPTVFGVFAGPQAARAAARQLADQDRWWVRVCRGRRA